MISPSLRERVAHLATRMHETIRDSDGSISKRTCYEWQRELRSMEALLDAIPASGQEPENTWFGWHLERGHTLTHRERYYECSCGATLWHEAKKSDDRQVNWGGTEQRAGQSSTEGDTRIRHTLEALYEWATEQRFHLESDPIPGALIRQVETVLAGSSAASQEDQESSR